MIPKSNRKQLKDFNQSCDMIRFTFKMIPSAALKTIDLGTKDSVNVGKTVRRLL